MLRGVIEDQFLSIENSLKLGTVNFYMSDFPECEKNLLFVA
jgi:hypothetical protein